MSFRAHLSSHRVDVLLGDLLRYTSSSAPMGTFSSHGNIIIFTSQWGCHVYNLDITWL